MRCRILICFSLSYVFVVVVVVVVFNQFLEVIIVSDFIFLNWGQTRVKNAVAFSFLKITQQQQYFFFLNSVPNVP